MMYPHSCLSFFKVAIKYCRVNPGGTKNFFRLLSDLTLAHEVDHC